MIIRKAMQTSKNWSGGTTTELLIYPENSDYKKVNFDWRISTASVENSYSKFTILPGVRRYIMSLTQAFMIAHEGRWQKLQPFQVHSFDGGLVTESKGQLIDFNLMTRNGYEGSIEKLTLEKDEIIGAKYLYLLKGCLQIKEDLLYDKDFFDGGNILHTFQAIEKSEVVLINIFK